MAVTTEPDTPTTVQVVMVAHDPGEWFEETLESLARQDYEHLSVAVVDAAGSGIGRRVRAVIQDADVIHAPGADGFSAAANAVLSTDLMATYFLVCHDDVVLAPDVVSILVKEAQRSNAGVAGPKLVHWDRPEVIQHVGFEVDRFGVASDLAGVDELDQEQHDTVRDAFAVSSATMLIKGDLFVRLRGFDPAMSFRGENVDLCWRAQMSGARVVAVGDATVRHREQLAARTGVDHVRLEHSRNSLRAMLVNHGRFSLLFFVPLAFVISLVEMLLSAVTGRLRRLRVSASAWLWNLGRLGDVLDRRRANTRIRKVRQADITALQYFGSVRVASFVRNRFGEDAKEGVGGFFASAGRDVISSLNTAAGRTAWVAWPLVVVVVLFGSRVLISEGVPAVGDFAPFPSRASDLIGDWWVGWSDRGTGAPSSNLTSLLWMGVLGWILELVGGSLQLVRTLWVIGPILVGLIGAYRMLAEVGSRRAQVGALVGYLVVPLATVSVASGSIAGLVGYAAAPWMLRAGLRTLGATPFGSPRSPQQRRMRERMQAALSLGTAAGLAALFVPSAVGLLVVIVAGLAVGSLLIGRPGGIGWLLAAALLSLPVIAFVAFPIVVDVIATTPTWDSAADGRDGSAGALSLAELLRFEVGPSGSGLRMWLLFAPMVLPLLLGRGWRLEQAVRLWMVAMTAWALAFAAQQGMLFFGLPDVHLMLAPAAIAASGLCGMAVLTVEHDLRMTHFGWHHGLVPITAVAALLMTIGGVGLLEDGRWGLARSDHHALLTFEPEVLSGSYRVLWIGAPDYLPVEGRSLDTDLAWAATTGHNVTISDRWVPVDTGRADLFETQLTEITEGRTSRGGRRLAGLGVRYVVLLHRLAPAPFSQAETARSVPDNIVSALTNQLDLEHLEGTNSAVDVFVNTSWVPMRSLYAPGFDSGVTSLADLEVRPLLVGAPILRGDGPPWRGTVPDSAEILVAHTPRPDWHLTVDGAPAERREALSWTQAYQPDSGGEVVLDYSPPWWRRVGQIVGVASPLMLLTGWLRRRISSV